MDHHNNLRNSVFNLMLWASI